MIYLIHGENQVDSRRHLVKLRSNYPESKTLDGRKLSSDSLEKFLSETDQTLFGEEKVVVIENFDGDWEELPKIKPDFDLIFWANKKIVNVPSWVKGFAFDRFKSVSAFKLADAVLYKKEKEAQILLNSLIKEKEMPEKILGALSRSFALTLSLKEGESEKITPNFVREKIIEQSRLWTKNTLMSALVKLLNADVAIKEGEKQERVLTVLVGALAER